MREHWRFWLLWGLSIAFLLSLFIFVRAIFVESAIRGPFVTIARVIALPVGRVDGFTLRYADVALHARVLEAEGTKEPFLQALESSADLLRLRRIFKDAGIEFTREVVVTDRDREIMNRYALTEGEWKSVFGERTAMIVQLSEEMKSNPVLQASARQETESLVDLLESGVAFSDLAREFSIDRSSVIGGELGAESPETLKERLALIRPDELVPALNAETHSILDSQEGFIILSSTPIENDLYDVKIIVTPKDTLQAIVDRYRSRYPLKRFY